jgi:hypothetical protein
VTEQTEETQPQPKVRPGRRRPMWRELAYIVAMYFVYSTVRNNFGSAGGAPGHAAAVAYGHALDVIRAERDVHLFFEPHVQSWYLGLPGHGLIQLWNVFYGSAHFIVTAGAFIWLYRRDPDRFPLWRNTVIATTLVGLVGFASFSLMPPRLLDEPPSRFGPPAEAHPPTFGFVDTLATYPTFWSFDSGGLKAVSNQYAAMPSLHMGWSLWSALVLLPLLRRQWARTLVVLYPIATLFCIIVTANHYWIDAAFGALALAIGYGIGSLITTLWDRRRAPDDRGTRSVRASGPPHPATS